MYDAVYPAREKWYEISSLLSVVVGTLDAIEEEDSTSKRLLKTLQEWLQNGTDCSWAALQKVMQNPRVGRKDIGQKLEALKYGRGNYFVFYLVHLLLNIIYDYLFSTEYL